MDKWPPTQPPLPLLYFIISCLFNSCHWMITCSYLAIPSMCFSSSLPLFFIESLVVSLFIIFFIVHSLLALWCGLVGLRARVTYRRHFTMHSEQQQHHHSSSSLSSGTDSRIQESVTSLNLVAFPDIKPHTPTNGEAWCMYAWHGIMSLRKRVID
ncbi:hypothetical protein BDW42DRAFT_157450 [Aspergillus taichungensis]|uniref:Uncharacterized protein n=1 Tax=Aspergillus taichungensis TaxID=482145 RepID=A0A2J5HKB3_9EURO|nr:hypothetical protein BDW42DRAFT_157450 [Aspergillus taichungensis]